MEIEQIANELSDAKLERLNLKEIAKGKNRFLIYLYASDRYVCSHHRNRAVT